MVFMNVNKGSKSTVNLYIKKTKQNNHNNKIIIMITVHNDTKYNVRNHSLFENTSFTHLQSFKSNHTRCDNKKHYFFNNTHIIPSFLHISLLFYHSFHLIPSYLLSSLPIPPPLLYLPIISSLPFSLLSLSNPSQITHSSVPPPSPTSLNSVIRPLPFPSHPPFWPGFGA